MMNNNKSLRLSFLFIVLVLLLNISCDFGRNKTTNVAVYHAELRKLEYNNPELLVDLDVGFKSVPMPMDFDGDGDYDLLISESGCYAESGVFYYWERSAFNVTTTMTTVGLQTPAKYPYFKR